LYAHAHEYGFVISYPENKQALTGYSFEPWHIRYVGVTMATELFNRGYLQNTNEEYLSKYLREKGLY
jgi:D-alanyl-D-alanine carboxypeptidase